MPQTASFLAERSAAMLHEAVDHDGQSDRDDADAKHPNANDFNAIAGAMVGHLQGQADEGDRKANTPDDQRTHRSPSHHAGSMGPGLAVC